MQVTIGKPTRHCSYGSKQCPARQARTAQSSEALVRIARPLFFCQESLSGRVCVKILRTFRTTGAKLE